jgi:hypothetical protein
VPFIDGDDECLERRYMETRWSRPLAETVRGWMDAGLSAKWFLPCATALMW